MTYAANLERKLIHAHIKIALALFLIMLKIARHFKRSLLENSLVGKNKHVFSSTVLRITKHLPFLAQKIHSFCCSNS